MTSSRNADWKEIWEAKGRRDAVDLHAIDGYDLLTAVEWEHMVRTLMSPIPLVSGMTVTELGCGAGAFLSTLRNIEPGLLLRGLDYASSLISIARQRIAGNFSVGDIRHCSEVATASSDLCCVFGVLMYLDSEKDVRQAISEIDRITRPGGHIFIGEISDLAKQDHALQLRKTTHTGEAYISSKSTSHLYLPQSLFEEEAVRHGWNNFRILDHADLPAMSNNPLAPYRFSIYAEKRNHSKYD
jgi:ubiquinone/menaquinone biosynthesis C-methylase UbiE